MAQVGENVAVSQQSLPQIQQKKSGGTKGGGKGGAKQKERLVYRHPLPIILRDAYNPLLPTLPSLISHLYAFYVKRQRPQQHPLVQALYLPLSKSVWVVDPDQAWILWTQGFFGKGSLSRSEPTWLTRKVKQLNGDPDAFLTLEEITAKRRKLRKEMKRLRAQEQHAALFDLPLPEVRTSNKTFQERTRQKEKEEAALRAAERAKAVDTNSSVSATHKTEKPIPPTKTFTSSDVTNLEVLQLTLQEAFFLQYGVGCLSLHTSTEDVITPITVEAAWRMYCQVSTGGIATSAVPLRPDNPFIINYVAYHHYRSLGWVVKTGVKFAADFLLYRRGPVFNHAEYAMMILPSYHPDDEPSTPPTMAWHKLSSINRVSTQVKKTVIICYVSIPSFKTCTNDTLSSPKCIQHYSVREVSLTRFIPNRNRD